MAIPRQELTLLGMTRLLLTPRWIFAMSSLLTLYFIRTCLIVINNTYIALVKSLNMIAYLVCVRTGHGNKTARRLIGTPNRTILVSRRDALSHPGFVTKAHLAYLRPICLGECAWNSFTLNEEVFQIYDKLRILAVSTHSKLKYANAIPTIHTAVACFGSLINSNHSRSHHLYIASAADSRGIKSQGKVCASESTCRRVYIICAEADVRMTCHMTN